MYRLSTLSFPPDVRAAHGHEMTDAFARMLDDRRERRALPRLRFVVRACLEAGLEGVAERARRLHTVLREILGTTVGPLGSPEIHGSGVGGPNGSGLPRGTGG